MFFVTPLPNFFLVVYIDQAKSLGFLYELNIFSEVALSFPYMIG